MSDQLRIGDAEREQAAADLGEHFAQGRLTADEHGERLDQAMRAKTRADLVPLFTDLPGGTYGYRPAAVPPYGSARSSAPSTGSTGLDRTWRPGRSGRIPRPIFVLLAILVAFAVLTNLPIVVIGLVLWVVVFKHRGWHHRC